jgi:M6 family metalloprotease-like protein
MKKLILRANPGRSRDPEFIKVGSDPLEPTYLFEAHKVAEFHRQSQHEGFQEPSANRKLLAVADSGQATPGRIAKGDPPAASRMRRGRHRAIAVAHAGVRFLCVAMLLWFSQELCLAAPYPLEGRPIEWVQPDGTRVRLRVFGDEFYARTATEDGLTVVFDKADLAYYFARLSADGKSFVATATPVGQAPPADIPPGLKEADEVVTATLQQNRRILTPNDDARWAARVAASRARRLNGDHQQAPGPDDGTGKSPPEPAPLGAPVVGGRVGLTIPVQFPDDPATAPADPVVFPVAQSKVERYCNEIGYSDDGNSGSIRDYFHDQSNGLLAFTNLVTSIVTLPHPRNYYNFYDYPANTQLRGSWDSASRMIADAIPILQAQGFDFSSLTVDANDNVISTSVYFAGPDSGVWAQGLWPHRSAIFGINVGTAANPRFISDYQITNAETSELVIGTFIHELGHLLLGYPDLYDYGGESAGAGLHCVMAHGQHLNSQKTPAPFNLYLKSISGWANIIDLAPGQSHLASLPTTGNHGRRIAKPGTATEYFLIENRGPGDKWADYCLDHGIAIWHIDESMYGNDHEEMTPSLHYQVSLEQADGLFGLERGPYHGDSTDLFDDVTPAFNDATIPSAFWWNGSPSGCSIDVLSPPGAVMNVRFSDLLPLDFALDAVKLAWTTDGGVPWVGQTTVNHDGFNAGACRGLDDEQSSWAEIMLGGPGTLTFWWKVSSESGWDFLSFRMDGDELAAIPAISGSVGWVQKTVPIPPGDHTLRWTYAKDSSVSSGDDAAWLDQVTFHGGLAADVLVTTWNDESNGSMDPSSGAGISLREAILYAPESSVIGFLPGTGTGTIALGGSQLQVSKSLSIDASSLGGGMIVSGNNGSRVFDIQAGKTVAMTRLKITDGEASGTGGGIRNAGSLTLNDCEISSNAASTGGGGIYSSGTLVLNSTNLLSNTCGDAGGALFAQGPLSLDHCILAKNTSGSNGGAIYGDGGTMSLVDCVLSSNRAEGWPGGGAIDNDDGGSATLTRCTLSKNSSGTSGGAIGNEGTLTLTACTLSGNTADNDGGAIEHVSGTLTLTSCTLAGNTANVGGAIDGDGTSTVRLYSCTVSGNHADDKGGGIEETTGTLQLENSIVAGNSAENSAPDIKCSSINIQGGVNLISSTNGLGGSFAGLVAAPGLAGLGNFGGPTRTMPPLPGSPAINAGGLTSLPTDQRGYSRVVGGVVDIGALETGNGIPVIVVDTLEDQDDGIEVGGVSLRDAIAAAAPGDIVSFDPGLDGGTIFLIDEPLSLERNLVIDASSLPGGMALTGEVLRAFEVSAGRDVAMNRLAISDIIATAFGTGDGNGAAVLNHGNLTLSGCIMSGNVGNQGGAILNTGELSLVGCEISSCSADSGGGVFNAAGADLAVTDCQLRGNVANFGGAVLNVGTMALVGSGISGNLCEEGNGAGVLNSGALTVTDSSFDSNLAKLGAAVFSNGTWSATRSRFLENIALVGGGGVQVEGPGATLEECIFSKNRSFADGGGIGHAGGSLTLSECTIIRNQTEQKGGGIYSSAGTLAIARSTVDGNWTVSGNGGGIHLGGAAATLTSITVSKNTSDLNGGGIYQAGGTLNLANSTICSNEAWEDLGGGIYGNGGTLAVTSCTIAGNQAVYEGGGIFVAPSALLTLANTIIAGNSAFDTGPDLRGAILSQLGVNLLGSAEGVTTPFSGIVADPVLAPLGLHGGPTLTMPPLPDSPAINAGGTTTLTTDQRGYARVVGGSLDIGSVETGNAISTIVVNTTLDEDDGIGIGNVSLREAVAGAEPGSIITFAAALDAGTLVLDSGPLPMNKNLVIDASPLAGGVTITGGLVRGFEVGLGSHAIMKGLGIMELGSPLENGGAILNSGNLELSHCILAGNLAGHGGAVWNAPDGHLTMADCGLFDNETINGDGGAMRNAGTAEVTRCHFAGNGSVFAGGAIHNTGLLTLTGSSVSENFADGRGGGVSNAGNLTIDRCTFFGNVAQSGDGGGISNSSFIDIRFATITGNATSSEGSGGGVYNVGILTLANSIVASNLDSGAAPDFAGVVDNQIGVNLLGSTTGVGAGFVGIVGNPLLAPFGDYGGPTPVTPPLPGSPVIEAATLSGNSGTDQLGNPCPSGPLPDIGAVEAVAFGTLGLADTDTDGIPDLLEPALGGTVGVNDAAKDSDGDGSTDAEEIGNMTDPSDPASYLRVVGFTVGEEFDPETNPVFAISFPTFPGLTYSIEADQNLDFTGFDHAVLLAPFVATGHAADFEVTLRPGRDFVRVVRHD